MRVRLVVEVSLSGCAACGVWGGAGTESADTPKSNVLRIVEWCMVEFLVTVRGFYCFNFLVLLELWFLMLA